MTPWRLVACRSRESAGRDYKNGPDGDNGDEGSRVHLPVWDP